MDRPRSSPFAPAPPLELVVATSVLFGLLLVAARFLRADEAYFGFLVWNLFLAAVPLALSRFLRRRAGSMGPLALAGLTLLWLLFFPNAPYILTDLFHLAERDGVPLWYDLVVFLTFAWNGLVLGFMSLRDVAEVVGRRFGAGAAGLTTLLAVFLGGFGVYVGRYLRWNSWDLLARPDSVLSDLLPRLADPLAHPGTWGMTLVFSAFLLLCYLTLTSFGRR